MKRNIAILLSTIFVCAAIPFASCGKKPSNGSSVEQSVPSGYLALNTYSTKIKVGETAKLEVKKYDEKDKEQPINSLQFISEEPLIAGVENGVITALAEGETYVNVIADGLESSVFVEVQAANKADGLVIRFSSQKLYQGVPVQAHAYILEQGVAVAMPEQVSWSVGDESILQITETGMVTPKALSEGALIQATCVYEGKEYTAEMIIQVVEPIYYAFNQTTFKLAHSVTLSGETNTSYTSAQVTVSKINALSGEKVLLDETQFAVSVADENVLQASVLQDGTITAKAKEIGETTLQAQIIGTNEMVIAPITVAMPIASIADMDMLSLATYNDTRLLSGDYILVNDIDYQGDVIMPITTYTGGNASTGLTAGIQWKYRLKKTAEGYAMEDRNKFGKAGTGLTDEEFGKFSNYCTSKTVFNKPFEGTIDGNGYSVKNAKIFYGAWVSVSKDTNYISGYSGIFGVFKGTLKNISFENISMQNPHDYMDLEVSKYGLDRVYTLDGEIVDGVLRKDSKYGATYYKATSYSLICRAQDCTLENVYFELSKGLGLISQGSTGIMVSWATGAVSVKNCVLYVKDFVQANRYAMCGTGSDVLGTFSCNLVVGMKSFHMTMDDRGEATLGFNGNWWVGDNKKACEWKDLFALRAGESATQVYSVEETAASFDENVWDMHEFGAGKSGRPIMKKGCSA